MITFHDMGHRINQMQSVDIFNGVNLKYCTCAIITRGFYIFTTFLNSISFFKGFFQKILS